jgi:hypothetical protein
MVGRSEKVTGDEAGSGLQLTGDQYLGNGAPVGGRAPVKVDTFNTLRGTGITGTSVGRSERVTGDEPGSCRLVTGDEYVGSQQYDRFCGTRPAPEAAKVGFSITNKAQVVSGTRTGRSEKVTGNEPGTCKLVTGTPYAGIDQAADWCSSGQVKTMRQRTPARAGTPGPRLSGQQPGIGGVMTGGDRGACENVTGTPYIGGDQFVNANCAPGEGQAPDFPNRSPAPPGSSSASSPLPAPPSASGRPAQSPAAATNWGEDGLPALLTWPVTGSPAPSSSALIAVAPNWVGSNPPPGPASPMPSPRLNWPSRWMLAVPCPGLRVKASPLA